MSEWYEAENDNIEIDGKEVNILVSSDYSGNVYVTLTFKQIENIYNAMLRCK